MPFIIQALRFLISEIIILVVSAALGYVWSASVFLFLGFKVSELGWVIVPSLLVPGYLMLASVVLSKIRRSVAGYWHAIIAGSVILLVPSITSVRLLGETAAFVGNLADLALVAFVFALPAGVMSVFTRSVVSNRNW